MGAMTGTRAEKMAKKLMAKVVEAAFYKMLEGRTIDLMRGIPAIYKAGEETYLACGKLPLTAEETKAIVEHAVNEAIGKWAVAS
jgi:hypothetical protein